MTLGWGDDGSTVTVALPPLLSKRRPLPTLALETNQATATRHSARSGWRNVSRSRVETLAPFGRSVVEFL